MLGAADVEAFPQLAQAFQVQAVPTAVAVVKGQPVPLFQGGAEESRSAPCSMNCSGLRSQRRHRPDRCRRPGRPDEAEAPPLPPLHQKAFDAIEAGDYATAAAAYRQALLECPPTPTPRPGWPRWS